MSLNVFGNDVCPPPNGMAHIHWGFDEIVCANDAIAKENAGTRRWRRRCDTSTVRDEKPRRKEDVKS
jgi:hypothetical protein